jgi:CRP-like cAMP-binding protein
MGVADSIRARLPEQSVLKSLSDEELNSLFAFGVTRRLGRGEVLFERGDPGDSMMVVLNGTLKAAATTAQGREVVFDYIGPGGVVGEIALLDGEPRTARVVAMDPAEVVVLQRRFLMPWLDRHRGAALRIINVLCRKLRRTNALVEDHAGLTMGPKLARGLLRLAEEHGVRGKDGRLSFGFPISQGDIGGYVSLSRENVNRQLREWTAAGYIELNHGKVVIIDDEALDAIADAGGVD